MTSSPYKVSLHLLNLPEEERASQSIANMLRYGVKGEEGDSKTGAGIESLETPPVETPPAEETPPPSEA